MSECEHCGKEVGDWADTEVRRLLSSLDDDRKIILMDMLGMSTVPAVLCVSDFNVIVGEVNRQLAKKA